MTNPLPQPLPIHLNLALLSLAGASFLPESLSLNNELPSLKKLSLADQARLKLKIQQNANQKLSNFYQGLAVYSNTPTPKWQPAAKIIWQEGSTRILDYGGKGEPILFISPLINRPNILDLATDKSLMKFLAKQGYRALLVDWGSVTETERKFKSDDYIARLKRFAVSLKNPIIGGYCMGGLLALKLAKTLPHKALILLATPWNFHAPDVTRLNLPKAILQKSIDGFQFVPPEFVHSLFIIADPWRVYNKYAELGARRKISPEFLEVENWVNDGVFMSAPLAKEIIIDWALENKVGQGEWLDVSKIDSPVFLACPTKDKIVPIGCSIPLAGLLASAKLEKFNCGHVGMITSKLVFEPLAKWLKITC